MNSKSMKKFIFLLVSIFSTLTIYKLIVESFFIESANESIGINTSYENVFFVESQNTTEHKLSGRQACSIESAALMNPDASIFVTFLTPLHNINLENSKYLKILRQYPNVKFKFVNIKDFAKDTLLERWIQSDELSNSKFIVSHSSDVLRYLLLYKYSGLYLDLDVIAVSSYGNIKYENFVCAESSYYLNGAVLKLTGKTGRKLAETFLNEIENNFSGTVWGFNGPHLLTRVIKKLCNLEEFSLFKVEVCENFYILPPSKCYAIGYEDWMKFFDENEFEFVKKQTKDSQFVHQWNKFSHSKVLRKNENTALNYIASKYCPRIYEIEKFL